jgi:hypothetical protein
MRPSSLGVLSRPLRWSLLGFAFSIVGTSGSYGSLIAIAGLVGTSAAVVPSLNLVDQVVDWSAPAVARLVSSRRPLSVLAAAEAVDAGISLVFASLVARLGVSLWLLLAFGTLTAITAIAIDISSEVFVAEEYGASHRQVVVFNSWISLVSVLCGSLVGRAGGTLLASRYLWAPFAANSVLSLIGCWAQLMAGRAGQVTRSEPAIKKPEGEPNLQDCQARQMSGVPQRRIAGSYKRLSLLLALVPAVWGSYLPLHLAQRHMVGLVSALFGAGGVGQALSAAVLPRAAALLSPERVVLLGALLCPLALALVLLGPEIILLIAVALYYASLIALVDLMFSARQISFRGATLGRLVSHCRIAASLGALAGSGAGYVLYTNASLSACLGVATLLHVVMLPFLRLPLLRRHLWSQYGTSER